MNVKTIFEAMNSLKRRKSDNSKAVFCLLARLINEVENLRFTLRLNQVNLYPVEKLRIHPLAVNFNSLDSFFSMRTEYIYINMLSASHIHLARFGQFLDFGKWAVIGRKGIFCLGKQTDLSGRINEPEIAVCERD